MFKHRKMRFNREWSLLAGNRVYELNFICKFKTYYNMIEILSNSGPAQTTRMTKAATYIFDYTRPKALYKFINNIPEDSDADPTKFEVQLAKYFKTNLVKFANGEVSSKWLPINIEPQQRQMVSFWSVLN